MPRKKGIEAEDVKRLPLVKELCDNITPSTMIEVHSLYKFMKVMLVCIVSLLINA